MTGPTPKRRPYHHQLVLAFLEHTRLAAVAAATGLSKSTVERWKAVPENWAEVDAARGELVESAISRLRTYMPKVAEELAAIAFGTSGEKAEAYVRVRALAEIRDTFLSLNQRVELEQRMSFIERALRNPPVPRASLLSPTTDRAETNAA